MQGYHPVVNFCYFLFIIGFAMLLMHPVCLLISLACGTCYAVILSGRRAVTFQLVYLLPLFLLSACLTPAFYHAGVTVIAYLPTGNPLTLESVIYGACAAILLIAVINWFSCLHRVMTSDQFIYLFGRVLPQLSLVLSMTLRFVPRFRVQLHQVLQAQSGIGRGMTGGLLTRMKRGASVLSIMITWSLESALQTADSMKSRGYGLGGRTSYSIFSFEKRDVVALAWIFLCGIYTAIGCFVTKQVEFIYFPFLFMKQVTAYGISVFLAYALLCGMPIFIEVWEKCKWKHIELSI